MRKVLFVYGTRPEAIKMAPLVREFRKHPDCFETKVCLTGQHREMLDQVNRFFGISSDFDLNLMQPNQTLFDVTANCLKGLEKVLDSDKYDLVFVQGDTTSVMAGAVAAYYKKIPVAHIEAGLRSGDIYSPYPEEANRKITSQLAKFHFAPTQEASNNLAKEGITKNVHIVGNTVIDALKLTLSLISEQGEKSYNDHFGYLDFSKRIILVTGHRRESFGEGFESICMALRDIASIRKDVEIVYPMHLNPNVREPVVRILKGLHNVHLIEPLDYPSLIWLMSRSWFVLTDSGGIQEEAPAIGKPVLVMRDLSERMEGVWAGTAKLVGTRRDVIIENSIRLLDDRKSYDEMAKSVNPYGDGKSSSRVFAVVHGSL